ncbi:MAG: choice-of-anchor D domain-containing protein, partial [Acidimicrobiia bacterium]|nr:choice-of-anchor D domain-containing protein [Acidimicrobiia bacterium]
GTASLGVSSFSIDGTDPADFAVVGSNCPGTARAPGQSCTVDVAFKPQTNGARSATLSINDNVPGFVPSQEVALAGTGVAPTPTDHYTAISPSRILDTRSNNTPLGPGETRAVTVAGMGGLPSSGVSAVVMNVTATQPTAGSYLTLFPTGQSQPTASNLNFGPGETVPNLVVVKLGPDGKVDLYNAQGAVQVVLDDVGYYGS